MLKWILGGLVVALLLKRNSVADTVTNAAGAPPEGNISTWGNTGSRTVGSVDPGRTASQQDATPNNSQFSNVAPAIIRPTVINFRTRGYYTTTQRYGIPGRL